MEKMNELSLAIDDLIDCGERLIKTGNALKAFYSDENNEKAPKKPAEPEKAAAPAKKYSREDIRGMLAAKAAEGDGHFKAAVKAIVKKYGNGGSLKDIPEEAYPDVAREVEELRDA